MLYFARWKIILIAVVSLAGLAFTIPNFIPEKTLSKIPDWLPHKHINLGLDLQGGSHLLLEVELDVVIRERLESLVDAMRRALRSKRIFYRDLGTDKGMASVTIRKPEQLQQAYEEIENLAVTLTGNPLTGVTGGKDIEVNQVGQNRITVTLTEEAINELARKTIEQSLEIVRRRIDELGTREPTIQRQGEERILVQVPGLSDPQRLIDLIGKTAKMTFRMVDVTTSPQQVLRSERAPAGSQLLESHERNADGSPVEYFVVRKKVMVSGDNLVDAQSTYDQYNQPVVSFRFDTVGGKRFGDATAKNVGRLFAIVLDDRVISAPVIREPILGGAGQISGNFTSQETQDLALLLRAGALPAPLKPIEQRAVGPSLGADSVAAGKVASIIGLIAVLVFMGLSYGIFGIAANVALVINMLLIFGALSGLQATLTLPGIAGIVLTIGMAVDANVLVFERIREEVRTGKSPMAAMEAGYRRALGTILDANITTFLAAVILFAMGSGPIKGFAVTLAIGILTSVFTAVTVTRFMLVTWMRRTRPQVLPI
jgi:preprotein translocase subunit SecD